jgi:hypothetical protein
VKRDQARFPRSVDETGRSAEILSPFSPANRETDARAFAALMQHLRAFDGEARTVLTVQVENDARGLALRPLHPARVGGRQSGLPPADVRHAALIRPGYPPGQYPSAGPPAPDRRLARGRAGAPAIDFIAPDLRLVPGRFAIQRVKLYRYR